MSVYIIRRGQRYIDVAFIELKTWYNYGVMEYELLVDSSGQYTLSIIDKILTNTDDDHKRINIIDSASIKIKYF